MGILEFDWFLLNRDMACKRGYRSLWCILIELGLFCWQFWKALATLPDKQASRRYSDKNVSRNMAKTCDSCHQDRRNNLVVWVSGGVFLWVESSLVYTSWKGIHCGGWSQHIMCWIILSLTDERCRKSMSYLSETCTKSLDRSTVYDEMCTEVLLVSVASLRLRR